MASNPSNTPVIRYVQVADAGTATLSWATIGIMGSVYIINKGPSVVSMAFDAVPASAAFGDNKKQIAVNEVVNLDDITYTTIGLRSVGGAGVANVEAIGVQRPGTNSGGGAA